MKDGGRRFELQAEMLRSFGNLTRPTVPTEKLLARFLTFAQRLARTQLGSLFIMDESSGELVLRLVKGKERKSKVGLRLAVGKGIAGAVAKVGKARLIGNIGQKSRFRKSLAKEVGGPTKDLLAVPLHGPDDAVMAVVVLLNHETHQGFDAHDRENLMALASAAEGAIANAILWAETRRRNQQYTILNRVSHLVNSTLDPREVRTRTIDAAVKLAGASAGSLLLLDPATGELFFEVALGEMGGEVKSIRLKKGEGIAGWVVTNGKPVMIQDCHNDPRWSGKGDSKSSFITHDMICVPVKARGKVIGAIQTINKKKGRPDDQDLEMLVFLAAQVAVALENARLFEQLQETFFETSEALAEAIELRDAYTGGHTRRVTEYSMAIGKSMGLSAQKLDELRLAAILHDIGKLGVDDAVLRKPGMLNDEEFEMMKAHPAVGAERLKRIQYLADVVPGIRSHHERADGRGYPDGLKGKQVPLIARIIAVADTFDAMTTDRPYRKGLATQVAVREIMDCTGTQFDLEAVAAFIAAFRAGDITGKEEKLPGKRSGLSS